MNWGRYPQSKATARIMMKVVLMNNITPSNNKFSSYSKKHIDDPHPCENCVYCICLYNSLFCKQNRVKLKIRGDSRYGGWDPAFVPISTARRICQGQYFLPFLRGDRKCH